MKITNKDKLKKNLKSLIAVIIIFSVSAIFFVYFLNYSINRLKPATQNKIYGFYGEERYNDEFNYNWMSDKEALIRVRAISDRIKIPVFCFKPDIKDSPVNLFIYINNKLIYEKKLDDSNVRFITINLNKLGYKIDVNNILDIKFKTDKLWNPGNSDKRMLGVAVGEILFLN